MPTAAVIGSGPNGLAAAITVAAAGVETTVFERNEQIGGGCSTAETTLPGFRHDLGSSVYPMGLASPFFRSLPIKIPWIQPDAPCAHPLDDGTAVLLERSIEATVAGLDAVDRDAYRSLLATISEHFLELAEDLLEPMLHVPHHPLLMAGFGPGALLPGATLAKWRFKGGRARALFAGMAAHSVLSLESTSSAAVGLVLMAAGHAVGWPILRGGAQTLADAMAGHLRSLGGQIETSHEVTSLSGACDVTLADITPRQLLRIAGGALPERYRKQLEGFRYGAGAFKVDYALSEPIRGLRRRVDGRRRCMSAAALRMSWPRSGRLCRIGHLCCWCSPRCLTQHEHRRESIRRGLIAMCRTAAVQTGWMTSNGRSSNSHRAFRSACWRGR